METRELYQKKYEAQLKEWGAKMDEIDARARKTAAQAQIDLKPHLESVKTKFETAKSKLGHIAKATDDAWGSVKQDAHTAWRKIMSSVEGAFAAIKTHQKSDAGTEPTSVTRGAIRVRPTRPGR
jgi:F0F1-type ATP synthase membrane subunit b/b'